MKSLSAGMIISIISFLNFVWAVDYDFRKAKWGMSREEVKASENLNPTEEDDIGIEYETIVLNHDVLLFYSFAHGKLWSAKYNCGGVLRPGPKCKSVSIYEDFKGMLTRKYGPPKKEDEPKDWKKTVSAAEMEVSTEWETDTTRIGCLIKRQGKSLFFEAYYVSKELEQLGKEFLATKIKKIMKEWDKAVEEYEVSLPLEVVDWHWYKDNNWLIAVGQVKNKTKRTLRYIKAVVTWYDKEHKMVTYDTTLIEYPILRPGQTSPFRVSCEYRSNAHTARLEFKELISGNKLPASLRSDER